MVLYINGNYPHHSLHSELVSKLADLGNEITVFVPMQGTELDGKYRCEHPDVKILYKDCLKTTDRVFFLNKIKRLTAIIEKEVDMTKVDCILAGTVYSDGFVAYELSKKYNIPFSVAVRETDVTYQMKWRPYLHKAVKNLLEKASRIIFLSPAYKSYFNKFHCDKEKFTIIPNAVNDYWFQHPTKEREIHTPVRLIYVGEISQRKNVSTTIKVVAQLNKMNIPTEFHIVGSGSEEKKCQELANELNVEKQVFFHGWQNNKEEIKAFYDQADIFIMPSYRETFGTVYIEALSQGIPVIYTKNQGIDGYFEQGTIGYACFPDSIYEIAEAVKSIRHGYKDISSTCIKCSQLFSWNEIASHYNELISMTKKRN